MTFPHHNTPGCNKRCRRKPEFISTKQRANHNITARPQATINLHRNPRAKIIEHQRLLRFSQPDFPRAAGVLDRGER